MNASPALQILFSPSHALDKQQLKPIFDYKNPSISNQPTDPKAISYLPGDPSIGLEETTVNDHLSGELKTYLLDELYNHLWLVGRRSGRSIDALHAQRLKGRSVVPTEDPNLHLVWHHNQIYIKPVPVCLFNYDFWEIYLCPTKNNNHPMSSTFDSSIAMGFLRSYAFLISHRLDFIIAKESHLIPEDIDWIAWSKFIQRFRELGDEQVAKRFHYGQLRLSRLNWVVRIFRPQHANTLWFYHVPHWSITTYLSQATIPLLFIFASVSVVLSAMQVVFIVFVHGLGSNPDTTWRARKLTQTTSASTEYPTWVSDFLPDDLSTPDHQDVRIFFFNFDSFWKRDAVQTRLSNIGNDLLEHITNTIRQSEVCVREQSAKYGGGKVRNIGLPVDHSGLNKFGSRDSSYQTILAILVNTMSAKSPKRLRQVPNNQAELSIPLQLPMARNDRFTGREFLLQQIHYHLQEDCQDMQQCIVALYGPGGIGKTQTAAEYAYHYQSRYNSVFWIDGASEHTIRQSFSVAAGQILKSWRILNHNETAYRIFAKEFGVGSFEDGKTSSTPTAHQAVKGVIDWLSQPENSAWLLIFDNLDDLDSFDIRGYMPSSRHGNILITSRRTDVSGYWKSIEVERMSENEAKSLLAKSSGFFGDMNEEVSLELLQLLGFFPLAIEQAGAYISVQHKFLPHESGLYSQALQRYIHEYHVNAERLLKHKRPQSIWDYRNDTILTTWEVSLQRIEMDIPEASELLLLCGFLSNNDIFEGLFTYSRFQQYKKSYSRQEYVFFESRVSSHLHAALKNVQNLPSKTKSLELRNSSGPPSDISLPRPLSVVYAITEGWLLWMRAAILEIRLSFFSAFYEEEQVENDIWWLAYKLTVTLRDHTLLEHTEQLFRWQFAEASQALHPKHPRALYIAGDIAWILLLQDRIEESRKWYEWLLSSRQKVQGPQHYATLGAVMGIASILERDGSYHEALDLRMMAYEGRAARLGIENPLTLNSAQAIGRQLFNEGRYNDAVKWFQLVFYGRNTTLGPDHEDTLESARYISRSLFYLNRYNESLEWDQIIWKERNKILGPDDKDTLQTVHNIALSLFRLDQHIEALKWGQIAWNGRNRTLGPDHKDTLHSACYISHSLFHLNRHNESLEWDQIVWKERNKTLGPDHEDTLQTAHDIALSLFWLDRHIEALKWGQIAWNGRNRTLGPDHEDTLHSAHNIGESLSLLNRHSEALEWMQIAWEGRNKTWGPDHEDTLASTRGIGVIYFALGKYDEAMKWLNSALPGSLRILGRDHEDTKNGNE
ncbi:hypothetical protein BDV38DRAFT_268144 [Aspergillus pseudotamarii]|uniref:NB-ARC domain-containing protein n=1 Tax=Aspergillus pseudotamarii TaxID=132259 RepID=A0A5N6T6H0_ASPPS|nr:uncharacterized protein BDV38DRAFT_268144 [Aspergillus pseudotamarii]KAE8141856.1 hypothetical protein BDV38DRAFT_268144 [Aspergillus pseudotamarii]